MSAMNNRLLRQILYDSWRPWVRDGTELFMDSPKEESGTTDIDSNRDDTAFKYFITVVTPEPEGRLSTAYGRYIADHLDDWYAGVIRTIEEAVQKGDRQYRYTVAKRDLLAVLQDIPNIRERLQHHPEEKENPISSFVLETASLRLANLLLDLEVR